MRMPLVWIERQLAAVIRPALRTVGAKGKGPPESPPTALFGFGSPGRTRTSDQSVTPVPPFPTGVDYLITVGRAACRWRALVGRLSFRHSLVSAPSLRLCTRRARLRVTICSGGSGWHLGFPEFTRFSLTGFPARLRLRHSRLLYRLSYRGTAGLITKAPWGGKSDPESDFTSRGGPRARGRRSSRRRTRGP